MSEKSCFVIAPIGEVDSDTRKRSDKILKYVIEPAVSQLGYTPIRADQISEPGMITSQVIQHIVEDPLVVADLTERNPNVFYELAIRHMLRKPFIQLIKKGEQIPFDVAGTRTIHVDHRDLDSVEEAKAGIVSQVKSLESNSKDLETPISVSLDLQTLRQSENPEQRSLADVLAVISELRTTVNGLEKKLDDPESLFPPPYVRHVLKSSGRAGAREIELAYQILDTVEQLKMLAHASNLPDSGSKSEIMMRAHKLEDQARDLLRHP